MNNPYDKQGPTVVRLTRKFLEQSLAMDTVDLYECCENGIHHSFIEKRVPQANTEDEIVLVIEIANKSRFAT